MGRKIETQRPQGFVVVNNNIDKGEKEQQNLMLLKVILFLSSQNILGFLVNKWVKKMSVNLVSC